MGKIRNEILKQFSNAMQDAESKSFSSAVKNLGEFRTTSSPKVYIPTYMLENSGRTTGIQGGGEHLNFRIYADMGFNYDTGTYSTPHVFNEAEVSGSGILGRPGFWQKTINETEEGIRQSFGKQFG